MLNLFKFKLHLLRLISRRISRRTLSLLGVLCLTGVVTPVFAEAPVYDVDSLPQQTDSDQQPSDNPSNDNGYQDANNDQYGANEGDAAPPAHQHAAPSSSTFAPPSMPQASAPPPQPLTNVPPPVTVVPADSSNNGSSGGFMPATNAMTMEQRMRQVEQAVSNLQSTGGQTAVGPDATARLDALQTQVQALTGQVEQLAHQVEGMQAQQKNLIAASAATAASLAKSAELASSASIATHNKKPAKTPHVDASAGDVTDTGAATGATDNQPNVAEEQQIYQTAYNDIKAKQYNQAVTTLQAMLKKYPQGQFASNAHYWLGELYGLLGKNDQALREFTIVVGNYPDSPRISDAQLKIGLIYASQSHWTDAKAAFKKVINKYPGTASARLAQEQLKQIKQAGH